MRNPVLGIVLGTLCLTHAGCGGTSPAEPTAQDPVDNRAELRSTLQTLADQSADPLLRLHFNSIRQVVEAGDRRSAADDQAIKELWAAFTSASLLHSPRLRESYLDRSRPLIVSWVSPTDGQVSFAWLTLPARWDPEQEYPLYIQLHGLWDVAQDRLPYLAYPFSHPATSYAFEDGYLVSPWGRGNLWYRGIAETDIWEGMAAVKCLVRVDESRQYLCGHSMGGYGAWHIAHRSADVWAALGIHAGALQYDAARAGRVRRHGPSGPPHVLRRRHLRRPARRQPERLRAAPGRGQPEPGLRHLLRRPRLPGGRRRGDVPVAAAVREMSPRVNRRVAPADRAGRRRGDRPRGRGRRSAAC